MRRKIVILLFIAAFTSIFGAVACGGEGDVSKAEQEVEKAKQEVKVIEAEQEEKEAELQVKEEQQGDKL